MVKEIKKLQHLTVIKRDGKEVGFAEEKIALAINKGFDSISSEEYSEADVNKVFTSVLDLLRQDFKDQEKISVEEIQDLIELQLSDLGYKDVLKSFGDYRNKRAMSRQMFKERYHNLSKGIEELTLKESSEVDAKRENGNVDGNTPMGTMLQFGSTISKEFAKSYLINKRFTDAHESGIIHIHDMDFIPMGTTTCCQIDLLKLFEKGFSTGHGHLRTPKDIMSYSALAAIVLQSNQNDQHGGQSLPAFDYFMAPGVLKTFKKQLKQTIYDYLEIGGFLQYINFDSVVEIINSLDSIEFDVNIFESYWQEEDEDPNTSLKVKEMFEKGYEKAYSKTNRITYQAMEAFVHNLNTMHSRAGAQVPFTSINFGTDTSPEGRMVMKNYLMAVDSGLGNGETPIFPISIFKLKEGVSYNVDDPNYDLFKLSCKVSAKRLFPNFSFLDSTFNMDGYVPGDYKTEVAYMGCRTRVKANVYKPKKALTTGRGNISFTSINLPRLGLKHGIVLGNKKADMKSFYKELEEILELVRDQLIERLEYQSKKRVYNFPFLLGQGVWLDSDNLKPSTNIKSILKHGSLGFGFIGLAETLIALTGEHHGQSKKSEKLGLEIITFMKNKVQEYAEEYKLNFSFVATPAEGLSGRFTRIDKAIYGSLEGITDREYYTNSFHIPVHYNITIADKIKLEGPYHALTNGGHISYIELDGDTANNTEAFEQVIRLMKENNMGYGAINHPVDRDPVCGYTGVIGDVCPGCGRKESEGISMERISSIDVAASC